jgi:hypothetical protein
VRRIRNRLTISFLTSTAPPAIGHGRGSQPAGKGGILNVKAQAGLAIWLSRRQFSFLARSRPGPGPGNLAIHMSTAWIAPAS